MPRQKRILTEEEKEQIAKVKAELREYRDNIKYIEEKKNDSEELKTLIESAKSGKITGLPAPKGDNPDNTPLEDGLDRIKEIEIDCRKKLEELLVKKYVVENKIEQLEQPYKSILYLKYIRGFRLYKISEELNYSYGYIRNAHILAMEKYAKL